MVTELPNSLRSPLGPVKVLRVPAKELESTTEAGSTTRCYGDFCWHLRRIRILDSLTGLVAWQVLYHEWAHMVLCDSGLAEALDRRSEELICDAIANARVVEHGGNARASVVA